MLAGGDGKLPARPDRERLFLEAVFRRELTAIGNGIGLSPASWRAAATAATLVPVLVMLFRRVTRWEPLREAPMTEWEPVRECDCRLTESPPDMELEDMDGRCVSGRDVCCISWESRQRDQHGCVRTAGGSEREAVGLRRLPWMRPFPKRYWIWVATRLSQSGFLFNAQVQETRAANWVVNVGCKVEVSCSVVDGERDNLGNRGKNRGE